MESIIKESVGEKILPLNTSINVCHHTHNVYPLMCILQDAQFLPWFYENFISLELSCEFNLDYYSAKSLERISIYDEVIEAEPLVSRSNDELIRTVCENIAAGKYVHTVTDAFYLRELSHSGRDHRILEALIHGYSVPGQVLHFVYPDNFRRYKSFTMSFVEYQKSFFSALKINEKTFSSITGPDLWQVLFSSLINRIPLTAYSLKKINRSLNPERVYFRLAEYLSGGRFRCTMPDGKKTWYGIDIYRGYYEEYFPGLVSEHYRGRDYSKEIHRGLYLLKRHKRVMLDRCTCLSEAYGVKFSKGIFSDLEKIIKMADTVVHLSGTWFFSRSPDRYKRLIGRFQELERFEHKVLQEVCTVLRNHIRKSMYTV